MKISKRIVDIVVASFGLILCLPVFLLVAITIKVDDGGPIFFRQMRIGRFARPFHIWKFRSMVPQAGLSNIQLTIGEDLRITHVGKFLRGSKLDELPQLLNVLSGSMSLVGPRPEVPKYVLLYNPDQKLVLELVPGITDPASIFYRDESNLLATAANPEKFYIEKVMPDKIRINLEYARHSSIWSDFKIILLTVFKLFG